MTTEEQITEIIERQYNGYRGKKLKPLGELHAVIRHKEGDEAFLKFLQKMEKENPMPKYKTSWEKDLERLEDKGALSDFQE